MTTGSADDFDQTQTPGGQPPEVSAAAPAGWYPVDGGMQRYWDGTAWTEHMSPGAGQGAAGPGAVADPAPFSSPGAGFPPGVGEQQPTWGAGTGAPYANTPMPFAGDPAALASTADDRSMAVLCHVLGIFTGFLGPLILWAVKKDQSRFIDHHGKQALNFQLSMIIYWAITFFAIFLLVGILLIPVLMVLGIVLPIIAAVAANKGESYRYPVTIPFLS